MPALIKLLDSADADVCAATARSLGRIASPEVVKALAGKMAAAPAELRLAIADACIECTEKLTAAGKRQEARPLRRAVRGAELPEHVKGALPRGRRGRRGRGQRERS